MPAYPMQVAPLQQIAPSPQAMPPQSMRQHQPAVRYRYRVRWGNVGAATVLVVAAVFSLPALAKVPSLFDSGQPAEPRQVAVQETQKAAPAMTMAHARARISKARAALKAGKFTKAAAFIEPIPLALFTESGASQLEDQIERSRQQFADYGQRARRSATQRQWLKARASLRRMARIAPLPADFRRLQAVVTAHVAADVLYSRAEQEAEAKEYKLALATAEEGYDRYSEQRFLVLKAEIRKEMAERREARAAKQAAKQAAKDAARKDALKEVPAETPLGIAGGAQATGGGGSATSANNDRTGAPPPPVAGESEGEKPPASGGGPPSAPKPPQPVPLR